MLLSLGTALLSAQSAQYADSLYLPEIVIAAEHSSRSAGTHVVELPDTLLSTLSYRSLSDVIANETDAYVRSYGNGGIATVSLRGGSSAQTAFIWNGVPLQNTMLGLQDLSVVPVRAIETIELSYGGQSATIGSGAVGGVVKLRNSSNVGLGLEAMIETAIGSFGRWDQNALISYGWKKFGLRSRVVHSEANNDFTYEVTPDLPDQVQEHARFKQTGIMQEIFYRPENNHMISARVWWQSTDREIPATTVQTRSSAVQLDKSLRTQLAWNAHSGNWKWESNLSYIRDSILYEDPDQRIYAPSLAEQVFGTVQATWSIDPSFQTSGGVTHTYIHGEAASYADGQHRTAIHLSHNYARKQLAFQAQIRQEIISGEFSPFLFGVGIEWKATNWMTVKSRISRDFRLPGLNDLYWVPGGNPDLKPEVSWGQEVGLLFSMLENDNFHIEFTGYNRMVDNWILWSIKQGETFWSAKNIAKVSSRGIESNLKWNDQIGSVRLYTSLGYAYTRSENRVAIELPQIEPGTQLYYVPIHQGNAAFSLLWNRLRVRYSHMITGSVTTDLNSQLDPYNTGRIHVTYEVSNGRFNFTPFVDIDNIWNASYRVIQYRPMPGRNFTIGARVTFNSQHKHS